MLAAVDSIVLRAEKHGEAAPHYVDAGQVSKLAVIDNQIGYGRRGTGKTHLLHELSNRIHFRQNEISIILDLQKMAMAPLDRPWIANPFTAAASVFSYVVSEVANAFFTSLEVSSRASSEWPEKRTISDEDVRGLLTRILNIADGSYQKPVTANIAAEEMSRSELEHSAKGGLKVSPTTASVDISHSTTEKGGRSYTEKEAGDASLMIQFPEIIQAFEQILSGLGLERVWLLVDEWSFIPEEVQPYLADLFRRTFAPSPKFTIKIVCLPHKTNLSVVMAGRTIGFEVGGDIFPGIDLDDILIYAKAPDTVELVFARILYAHLTTSKKLTLPDPDKSIHNFANAIFSDRRALVELIKASEGNPRDFLHIFVTSYRSTFETPGTIAIGIPVIRNSAADWFERDKLKNTNPIQKQILQRLISEVIRDRKSKLFLARQERGSSPTLRDLQHSRLLHRWHRGYAAKGGQDSERYDVYAIDYGAYVDLRTTVLGREIDEEFVIDSAAPELSVEVPDPDKRKFRHIVLPDDLLDEFDQMLEGVVECPHCRARFSPSQRSYMVRRLCPECFEPAESPAEPVETKGDVAH
jgi:hypothetical protein